MIVVTLVGFFIDLFGTAFRKELAIAGMRTNELTRLHESLEAYANNVLGLKEQLEVTLRSIGDAVITTDLGGHVVMLNAVAEQLTGWTDAEVQGQPLESVFHIVNETTRIPVENPVTKVLQQGVVVGLIPRELHKVAFEPFRQVGLQDPAQRKGTGLGLAICKHIIEAHGGEIWIDAEVQSGTAIIFTLPLTREGSTV